MRRVSWYRGQVVWQAAATRRRGLLIITAPGHLSAYPVGAARKTPGEKGRLPWENSIWYGDSPPCIGHIGGYSMIGTAMTILMGAYSEDHTDVAIISDRKSTPNSLGRAAGVCPKENVYKTLRLGPHVAIGFAGTVPLQNVVLAKLLGIPVPDMESDLLTDLVAQEGEFDYEFDYVVYWLNLIAASVIATTLPSPGVQMCILIAGRDDGRPILVELNATTGYTARELPRTSCKTPAASCRLEA